MNAAAFLAWRLARRLTQREAAALLGIGQKRVWAIEAGKAPVSKQTERQMETLEACEKALPILAALCNALGETCGEEDVNALAALQDVTTPGGRWKGLAVRR